jgi:hypothetical protein
MARTKKLVIPHFTWSHAVAAAAVGPWQLTRESDRPATRTGGPDDDDDDEDAMVRKLLPIATIVVVLATVFGG